MKRAQQSPRIRPCLRRFVFTDRVGGSLAVMQHCYAHGIDLHVDPIKPGERGAGKPLPQDW